MKNIFISTLSTPRETFAERNWNLQLTVLRMIVTCHWWLRPIFHVRAFLEATTATLATRTTDNRARCRLKLSKIQWKHFPLITSRHRHSQPLNQQNVNVVSLCDAGAALRSRRRGTKTLFRWNSSAEFRGMLGLLCVTDLLHRRRFNVARWLRID